MKNLLNLVFVILLLVSFSSCELGENRDEEKYISYVACESDTLINGEKFYLIDIKWDADEYYYRMKNCTNLTQINTGVNGVEFFSNVPMTPKAKKTYYWSQKICGLKDFRIWTKTKPENITIEFIKKTKSFLTNDFIKINCSNY